MAKLLAYCLGAKQMIKIERYDFFKISALSLACCNGYGRMVRLILQQGVDYEDVAVSKNETLLIAGINSRESSVDVQSHHCAYPDT